MDETALLSKLTRAMELSDMNRGIDELFTWYFKTNDDATEETKVLVYNTVTTLKEFLYDFKKLKKA